MNDQYDESQGDFPAAEGDLTPVSADFPSVEAMYGDLPAIALVQESEYVQTLNEGPVLLGPPAMPAPDSSPFDPPQLEHETVTLPAYDALFGEVELSPDLPVEPDSWPPHLDHQQAWLDENFATLPSMTSEPVWATVGREMNVNVEDLLSIQRYGW